MQCGEMLGMQLLSMHNVEFLIQITYAARKAIEQQRYSEFKKEFYTTYRV